jgi:hypothetical protein
MFCKKQYLECKYYEVRDDKVSDVINKLGYEFEQEDINGKFNSKILRNVMADYCVYLHGGSDNWIPAWKNSLYSYRKKQDISKLVNKILYPNRKRQHAINIGFVILAIHFIYAIILSRL